MGWGSFLHSITHPIEAIKHAGSSIFHAVEKAAVSGVNFVKHTAEKVAHAVMHSAPVEFVKHTVHKVTHAITSVGVKIVSGAKSAVTFVKHAGEKVIAGATEVWHGMESVGGSLVNATKMLPLILMGGAGLLVFSTLRSDSFEHPAKRPRFGL